MQLSQPSCTVQQVCNKCHAAVILLSLGVNRQVLSSGISVCTLELTIFLYMHAAESCFLSASCSGLLSPTFYLTFVSDACTSQGCSLCCSQLVAVMLACADNYNNYCQGYAYNLPFKALLRLQLLVTLSRHEQQLSHKSRKRQGSENVA